MPEGKTTSYDFFSPAQKKGGTAESALPTAFTPTSAEGLGGYRTSLFSNPSGRSYGSYNDPGTIQLGRVEDKYNLQRLFTDVAFERGREDITRQLGAIGQGYDQAEGAVSRYGRSARQTALDREQGLAGELSARSGGSSYMYDYYRRSLSADTTRALQAVDEELAGLFAGLYTQRGLAEAGTLGNRAATYFQQADAYQSLLSQQLSAELGFAPGQSAPRDYSGLYSLAGDLAQAYGTYAGSQNKQSTTTTQPA